MAVGDYEELWHTGNLDAFKKIRKSADTMTLHIEYITDANGKQESVVIPHKQWNALLADYQKTKKKLEVLNGIGQALTQVELIKKGKLKKQTPGEFLN